ncbi:MAG: hypothetical protein CFE45_02295 [Burkholderiales bacterium PBB5]|nr:MAG: hypothetical protein CFE45_02295 [Burkholderiales bacterium PBB5]
MICRTDPTPAPLVQRLGHDPTPPTDGDSMDKISGNRFLAQALKAYGIDHFFNVPMIVPPGIKELTALGVKSIVTHSEKAAAYMADGYARESGRVGVCASQAIGATNLASGLLDALMAKSPVLALTGGSTPDTRERNFYQEIDQRSIYAGLTKFSARVEKAQRLPDLLAQALRVATTGSPGPVHLELGGFWGGVLMEEFENIRPPAARDAACPSVRPTAAPEDIQAAATALRTAQRPVIMAGSGVRASRAQAALLNFARRTGIPVATSLDAKSVVPESDPLCIGVAGDYSRDTANAAVSEADLVLFVGSSTGSMATRQSRSTSTRANWAATTRCLLVCWAIRQPCSTSWAQRWVARSAVRHGWHASTPCARNGPTWRQRTKPRRPRRSGQNACAACCRSRCPKAPCWPSTPATRRAGPPATSTWIGPANR